MIFVYAQHQSVAECLRSKWESDMAHLSTINVRQFCKTAKPVLIWRNNGAIKIWASDKRKWMIMVEIYNYRSKCFSEGKKWWKLWKLYIAVWNFATHFLHSYSPFLNPIPLCIDKQSIIFLWRCTDGTEIFGHLMKIWTITEFCISEICYSNLFLWQIS